jgi:transcription antitermination factor NusG
MLEPYWYAVRVKSNRERVTADALRGKDLEVCLPIYRQRRVTGSRTRIVELPLFAGYVFSRFDIHNRLPVLTVPGVVHIVGLGNVPQPVDPGEMASVFTLTQTHLKASPHPFLPLGRRVQLRTGPLRGVEGVVVAHKNETKLVVSVSLLQRSVAIDVEHQWIDGLLPALSAAC